RKLRRTGKFGALAQHLLQEAHGALDITERAAHHEASLCRLTLGVAQRAFGRCDDQRRGATEATRAFGIEQTERFWGWSRRRRALGQIARAFHATQHAGRPVAGRARDHDLGGDFARKHARLGARSLEGEHGARTWRRSGDSGVSSPTVGGSRSLFTLSAVIAASIAPAAPSVWPICALEEETQTRPTSCAKTRRRARASMASF